MISFDAPKHNIIAYQKQQDVAYVNGHEISTDDDLVTRKKSFPIGSLFYFTLQTAASTTTAINSKEKAKHQDSKKFSSKKSSFKGIVPPPPPYDDDDDDDEDEDDEDIEDDEKNRNPLTIEIPPLTKLSIDTITVDPKSSNHDVMSLYISTDSNEFVCICPALINNNSNNPKLRYCQSMIQNLNLSLIGPTSLQFALVSSNHDKKSGTNSISSSSSSSTSTKLGHVNIFGRVEMVDENIGNTVVDVRTTHVFDELQQINDAESAMDGMMSEMSCDGNESYNKQSGTNPASFSSSKVSAYKPPTKISFESLRKAGEETLDHNENIHENNEEKNVGMNVDDLNGVENETMDEAQSIKKKVTPKEKNEKKRKLEEDEEDQTNNASEKETTTNETATTTTTEPTKKIQKLSRKQRRKLAKQKAKELQEVIAKEQGHAAAAVVVPVDDDKGNVKDKKKSDSTNKISLTKQRALSCGVLVRDIVHGTGTMVRMGRKVSINYVGSLADNGKEFDKNSSKANPLVFRIGTGEVIKGLDKGMEGMKVGGERSITIPPELGYGRKKSGKIPPNSTLCFEVKLLSVGGSQK